MSGTAIDTFGRAWRAYWFPQTNAVRLAVVRIIFVALQLLWFFEPLSHHLMHLDAPGIIQPQAAVKGLLLLFSEQSLRTATVLTTLWWVTLVAGWMALLGLFTPVSMFTFASGCLWLINHNYSYGEVHHPEAIFLVALFCLGLSPCGLCLSADAWLRHRRLRARDPSAAVDLWGLDARTTLATWPLRLVQWLLVIAYFEAFLSKITTSGIYWMNGYTLQRFLLMDGIRWDCPLGVYLARFRWLCVFLAAGTLFMESTFWVVMVDTFGRRFHFTCWVKPFYFLGGIGLHVGIYVLQAAPFWQFLALYLTWVPFERLIRPAASPDESLVPQPVPA